MKTSTTSASTTAPKGNPTLKTLIAVLSTLDLRLTVVRPPKKKKAKTARKMAA
jgi:DNA-binding phage protein